MTCPLTSPIPTPTTEPTPIGTLAFVASLTADYWGAQVCWCGARRDSKCVTASGRVAAREHKGRAA